MRKRSGVEFYWILVVAGFFLAIRAQAETAAEILRETGIDAGLFVHLGAIDGRLERDLAKGGRILVQGLALDEVAVSGGRLAIEQAGLLGLATIDGVRSFQFLPYNTNLVTVVIADLDALGAQAPSREEILRVIHPFGTAYLKENGRWQAVSKPLPPGMDQWTHADHGPDGNPQSTDEGVAAPRGVQWHVSGAGLMGSELRLAGGRWFRASESSGRWRGEPSFECRNAFNGLLNWRNKDGRSNRSRRGVLDATTCADHDRVYGILDDPEIGKAWDARSGREVAVFVDGLRNAAAPKDNSARPLTLQHMVVDGTVIQSGGDDGGVAALDAQTAKLLWKWQDEGKMRVALAVAGGGRVYAGLTARSSFLSYHYGNKFAEIKAIVAFDLRTGQEVWRNTEVDDFNTFNFLYSDGALFMANGRIPNAAKKQEPRGYESLIRIDAATGKTVFNRSIADAGPKNGEAWTYKLRFQDGLLFPAYPASVIGFDPGTGEKKDLLYELPQLGFQDVPLFCSTIRGTPRGFVSGKFTRFVDVREKTFSAISVTRSGCDRGSYPAYGMLYAGTDECGCTSFLRGHVALHCQDYGETRVPDAERLIKGPAFGKKDAESVDAWPMLLADTARSAVSPTTLPSELRLLATASVPVAMPEGPIATDWREDHQVLGALTAPVIADGLIFVAATHQQRLYALDAVTGKTHWSHAIPARIDSPPTIYRGLCIFGGKDGWVNALSAGDGTLAWRFLAAPSLRRVVASGQVESAWPVHGSVLTFKDKLFVTAGRHNQSDGGIMLWRLDPISGAIEASTQIDGRWTSAEDPGTPSLSDIQGKVHDILATNFSSSLLYMNAIAVDPESFQWMNTGTPTQLSKRSRAVKLPNRLDRAKPDFKGFIFNHAVGTIDRRNDSIGAKGQHGYRYNAFNGYDEGIRAIRMARADRTLFLLQQTGDVQTLELRPDGAPNDANGTERQRLANVGAGRAYAAMVITRDHLCIAHSDSKGTGSKLVVLKKDGSVQQEIPLPALPISHGLAAAGGRLVVTLNDGTVQIYGR